MISAFELIVDADTAPDGGVGVQIHVEISPLGASPPLGGLATTGADLPIVFIVAAVALIAVGAAIVVWRARRTSGQGAGRSRHAPLPRPRREF